MDYGINFLNIEYLFRLLYLVITGQIFFAFSGGDGGGGSGSGGIDGGGSSIFAEAWFIFSLISGFISLLLLFGIIYYYYRIKDLEEYEEAVLFSSIKKREPQMLATDKWQRIRLMIDSHNPSDWRQAIIEADIMLDQLITSAGYQGNSLGEKLKNVERGDFPKIQEAWDAHKVRNEIAHRGSDFILTRREALRAMNLYEQVFSEFYFVE
jgi:hypothetical protein